VSTKHTPGPWYVIGEDDYRNHSIDDFMVCAQVGPDPGDADLFITNIGPQCQPVQSEYGEVNLANARLIAAAPDLLEALRALVESDGLAFYHDDDIEGTVRVCVHCHEFSQTPAEIDHDASCIVGKVRAAIAKAEGRS